ncbi:MAG TPA: 16S rRNA (cytosine(1402)-N(4))-methyltransferase RsmH [Candidatus Saccharimonadales bacterium]|nr:16S rRNA (cytosine(1402)-N(4))-methyltransferase RsmH [Candidatus Saccharimonadales bacterium]
MNNYHTSVLLHETIEELHIETGKLYIDGTIGGGGHTYEILKNGGKVLGIDVDDEALEFARKRLEPEFNNVILVKGNFRDINKIAKNNGFDKVSGILLDLGISSRHVDSAERGFSFIKDGPLDMRMNKDLEVTAGDLVNGLRKNELIELFTKLGEEGFARMIAGAIVNARKESKIETTTQLAEIIKRAVPFAKKGIHPATKAFQALRIAVNDELNVITETLPKAVSLLAPTGRLAVITFHSLEDRIVKQQFIKFEEKGLGKIVTKKPIIPTEEEIEANSRARSSKLRVFERV